MKKFYLITGLVLFVFAVICCTKQSMPNIPANVIQRHSAKDVSYVDAFNYAAAKSGLQTKGGDLASFRIDPVVDEERDTLLYIVNYPTGWQILSGDKRTPAVVAYGDSGSFSLKDANPALRAWIDCTAKDIKAVKRSSDSDLTFSADEIRHHINAWKQPRERWIDPNLPIDGYIVVDTLYYDELVEVVPHMVPAHWDQGYPYNMYCPTDLGGDHYAVGCGGVAGGSMLHYLYKQNNYPTSYYNIPMDSIGVVYNRYDDPIIDSTHVTARYLKAVNDHMNVIYSFLGTAVLPDDMVGFFEDAGYSCDYDVYNANTVASTIWAGTPVLMLAFSGLVGHYFIIDGYQVRRPVIVEHQYVVSVGPNPLPPDDRYRYLYIGKRAG